MKYTQSWLLLNSWNPLPKLRRNLSKRWWVYMQCFDNTNCHTCLTVQQKTYTLIKNSKKILLHILTLGKNKPHEKITGAFEVEFKKSAFSVHFCASFMADLKSIRLSLMNPSRKVKKCTTTAPSLGFCQMISLFLYPHWPRTFKK